MEIIIVLLISVSVDVAFGLKNPSAVYCEQMGYEFIVETTESGQMGVCKFSETESCPAWDFLTGKCGKEYSYCSKKGYQLKTTNDRKKCSSIPFSRECAVCILKDGTEVEVTKLMGLSFEEGVCGDGRCVLGENYKTCPQDCPSGSADFYCDGILDGICDPDCTLKKDPDCLCGDGVCEDYEIPGTCCLDCGCPSGMKCVENKCIEEKCGDNLCEPNYDENYKTCSQDCPSGSKDGYCDKVKDGICDPDCKPEEDFDCKKKSFLLFVVILFIIITLTISIYIVIKKWRKRELQD